jgi:gluconolactonase
MNSSESLNMRVLCEGLQFPEGPIALRDGSVLVVEIRSGDLTRVDVSGRKSLVAHVGGGPNGAAIGPDGACYVCNNGGFDWHDLPDGSSRPGLQSSDYVGGSIQRVDLRTGEVRTLYEHCDGQPLNGPNDIVFDELGGFWFTDLGKRRAREMDHGGVYYALPDGTSIRQMVFPLTTPNGLGLSPDGRRLYVAETGPGRLWAFDLEGPGQLGNRNPDYPNGGTLVAGIPGFQLFDSLAVEAGGPICVATLFNGGITVISREGRSVDHIPLPDPFTTNICFGGADMKTAFVTLSSTGRLVQLDWPRPGLRTHAQISDTPTRATR